MVIIHIRCTISLFDLTVIITSEWSIMCCLWVYLLKIKSNHVQIKKSFKSFNCKVNVTKSPMFLWSFPQESSFRPHIIIPVDTWIDVLSYLKKSNNEDTEMPTLWHRYADGGTTITNILQKYLLQLFNVPWQSKIVLPSTTWWSTYYPRARTQSLCITCTYSMNNSVFTKFI